jgi:hypothetical protein
MIAAHLAESAYRCLVSATKSVGIAPASALGSIAGHSDLLADVGGGAQIIFRGRGGLFDGSGCRQCSRERLTQMPSIAERGINACQIAVAVRLEHFFGSSLRGGIVTTLTHIAKRAADGERERTIESLF